MVDEIPTVGLPLTPRLAAELVRGPLLRVEGIRPDDAASKGLDLGMLASGGEIRSRVG